MGLIRRFWYRWSWRTRYWWLDTRPGRMAQLGVFGAMLLGTVLQLTHMMIVVATAPQPDAPDGQQHLDGCDVAITAPTDDASLPGARGGVA